MRQKKFIAGAGLAVLLAVPAVLWFGPPGAQARERVATLQAEAAAERGPVTGLPLPRYVSLKAGRANARRGPGTDFPIDWVYTKRGVPLEIIAESNHWRRIRDHDGDGGWIWHTMLDGARSVIVTGDKEEPRALHDKPDAAADVVAYLEPGIVAAVRGCKAGWCRLEARGHSGWAQQSVLWGVYPGEEFE
ncbi:MAG: SH3 domain-containing protein [Parvibaculum sp.]|uniref:SH3 domain-containing protein n=1 Tax=Parvibaculum sp. TaxID=2024848 RepID=UPI0034A053A9